MYRSIFQNRERDSLWPIKSRPNHITKRIVFDAFRIWIRLQILVTFSYVTRIYQRYIGRRQSKAIAHRLSESLVILPADTMPQHAVDSALRR